MARKKFRLTPRYKYFLERQFIKGAHYQLLAVAALIGIISVVGGLLVWPEGEPTPSLGESIWWAFLRLSDPGYLGDDEGAWRRFVSTIITVAGYVVFLGSLVAIITSWLNRKLRTLEQGLTPIAANNHVIILGWNNRTIHIAGELMQSSVRLRRFLKRHKTRRLKLVILSDDVTPDRLQELKDHRLIGRRGHEIVLRSGVSIDREHLRRVDSLNASAIIIPSKSFDKKELITPDVETIKTLLSLNAEAGTQENGKLPYVVAEIQDENKVKAAQRAYTGPLEVISSDTIISRLVAQNIRHHGLSVVYNEILTQGGDSSIFVRNYSEATSKTTAEVKKAFPFAIFLGIVRLQDNHYVPFLNPPPDEVITKEDRLILLADSAEDIDKPGEFTIKSGKSTPPPGQYLPVLDQEGVSKILILGWNRHVPALIHELDTYDDENYDITIASIRPLEVRSKELTSRGTTSRVKYKHVMADYVRETELRQLVTETAYDNIILVSSDRFADEEEADARTIVGYILLEDMLDQLNQRPQVLLELSDPNNELLLERFKSELIIETMILSHLLAQVSLRRELHCIYDELFTVGGAEIIFRTPKEYNIKEQKLTFRELEQKGAAYNETVLGVYSLQTPGSKIKPLQLNLTGDQPIEIHDTLQIVALTTIY